MLNISNRRSRRSLVAAAALSLAATAFGAWTALPAVAAPLIEIEIAPPAPQVEVVPEHPRPGFVWVRGYWRWEGHRHIWVKGTWMKERPGHHWVDARWTPVGGHYRFEEGHWD